MRTYLQHIVVALVASGWILPSVAEDKFKPIKLSEADVDQEVAAATVERICELAVNNISIRYNLNAAQKQRTDELMKRSVKKFLEEHEKEVWPAIRKLLGAQLGTKLPDSAEEIQGLGKAVGPLVGLAKDAIFSANEEWANLLTEDQKRVHDFDMNEMRKTFEQIENNVAEWRKGESKEAPLFPPTTPEVLAKSPPRPRKPSPGLPEPPVVPVFKVEIFDVFVEEFVKDYSLNEGQVVSARSILGEFKKKAEDFRKAKRPQLRQLGNEQKLALEKRDTKRIAELDKKRKEILQPIYRLFRQMELRLKGLLTSAQLELYNQKNATDDATDKPSTEEEKKLARKSAPPSDKEIATPAAEQKK